MRLFAVLLFCSAFAWATPTPRPQDNNLTQAFARARRQQIKSVSYELAFDLEQGATTFQVKSLLAVELNHTRSALTIDLVADKIGPITVNGKVVKNFKLRQGSFDIPASALSLTNRIVVEHVGSFSKEANGFQRSVDPEDKAEYLFTDFEPYYAHKLFPCFDQPDIKATYQVTVQAPAAWTVIHNEPVSKVVNDGGRNVTTFPATKPLSPYLFFLGAGPFVEWKDSYQEIPLTLYARKTLAKYVDHQNIFATTKKGLAFFSEYFGMPYPFSKYGQVFIPEFAWGGMENPGAVTLNERNVFRGPVPQIRRDDRDNLILHEMAHMWFGDLVTMEWWNDLWLNESFATYAASLAQDRGLGTKTTWLDFFSTKTWGYWQDQLVTTHPIETPVGDVRTAKGNFDGITYAKGASALKQLHFFVGEKGFREGLQSYFKIYAFKNTRRADFINEIGQAAQQPLTDWTKKWLQTAGPNRVKLIVDCQGGTIKRLAIEQKPSVSNTISPHRTRLGLYELRDGSLVQFRTHDVVYQSPLTEISELVGTRCADFFLPNQEDQDYALFALDEHSLKQTKASLTTLADPLSSLMVWNSIYQMVRDGALRPGEYMTFAQAGLAQLQDAALIESIIGAYSPVHSVYWQYLNKSERAQLAPELEATLWQRMTSAAAGSSLQMTFFDFYLQVVQSPEAVEKLHTMLTSDTPPRGIVFDQDRRWAMITTLARNGHKGASALIEAEKKRDASTLGERLAYSIRAALPEAETKQQYWREFFERQDLPYTHFLQAAKRIHSANHLELSQTYVDRYFQRVRTLDWEAHDAVVDVYFEALFPGVICSADLLKRSERELKLARKLTPLARRSWREANDELSRCVRVRAPMGTSKPDA